MSLDKHIWKMATFVLFAMAVVITGLLLFPADGLGNHRPHFAHSTLVITSPEGDKKSFDVEVASTTEEQAYGLMFLTSLGDDKGMIFPSSPPRMVAFWMKNTLIPLDMLFVRPDGKIGSIVAEARPRDLKVIPSDAPVSAVIEIMGGQAKKQGINVGDRVESPALPVIAQ